MTRKAYRALSKKACATIWYPNDVTSWPYHIARFDSWVSRRDPCTIGAKV